MKFFFFFFFNKAGPWLFRSAKKHFLLSLSYLWLNFDIVWYQERKSLQEILVTFTEIFIKKLKNEKKRKKKEEKKEEKEKRKALLHFLSIIVWSFTSRLVEYLSKIQTADVGSEEGDNGLVRELVNEPQHST